MIAWRRTLVEIWSYHKNKHVSFF